MAAEKPIRRSTHVDTPDYLRPPPRPPVWPWAIVAVVVGVPAAGLGGVGGAVGVLGLVVLALALVALITGNPGPLRLSNTLRSGMAIAVGIVLLVAAGGTLVATGRIAGDHAEAPAPSASAVPAPSASDGADEADGDGDAPAVDIDLSSMTAQEVLDALPVKGPAAGTGYSRVLGFGESWLDVDDNGCDTRNDILQRDLDDLELDGACRVLSGTLHGPYTGETIDFVRGVDTSRAVQIDHVVALKDAWRTGAQQLTPQQRVLLANDPLNLLAVAGGANAQKGDRNAAGWLPKEKGFRCEYVARQVSVKAAYGLWVVPSEKDAIAGILRTCPEQAAFVSPLASDQPEEASEKEETEEAEQEPAPEAPAPVVPAPPMPAPVDPAPVEPAPVDPAPVDPEPSDPVPSEPAPGSPEPVDPAPTDPPEPDPAPTEPAPTESVPDDTEHAPEAAAPAAAHPRGVPAASAPRVFAPRAVPAGPMGRPLVRG